MATQSIDALHTDRRDAIVSTPWQYRLWEFRPVLIGLSVFVLSLAGLVAGLSVRDPIHDGEAGVTLALDPFPPPNTSADLAPPSSFRQARSAGGHPIADPALIEELALGPLPKRAADGKTPLAVYARAFDRRSRRPKIALVIRGMGVSANTTVLALSRLPPSVTLAFSPFTAGLQAAADKARGAGHELLLEVPMEPPDFPESDPGPYALLAAASPEEIGRRLQWALSRATGYVGVMNSLGARFLGEESAIEPVLDQVARRGLMFFDSGVANSVALTSARHARAPLAVGTLNLDLVPAKPAIDAKLAELEEAARRDGFAIGVGSLYPVTIARVAEWSRSSGDRGFDLVPVSALAKIPGAELARGE